MGSKKGTYRSVLIAILVWEIIFWTLLLFAFNQWRFFEPLSDHSQLVFKNPTALWYMLIGVPMLVLFAVFLWREHQRYRKLGDDFVVRKIVVQTAPSSHFIKFFLFRNFVVFAILAWALPVMGTKSTTAKKENKELVLAMDISLSMNVKDAGFTDSRLTIAKRAATQFINNLKGEKIGIVIFAGNAYVQLPLTTDYEAAKMYVDEIETSLTSNQGTALSTALIRSQQVFTDETAAHAVILFSDVEDQQGGLDSIVEVYREQQVHLSILAIGTSTGGLIPNSPSRSELGYKMDENGRPIVSKMNLKLVRDLAKQTNGNLLVSENSYPNVELLLQNIKGIKRVKSKLEQMDVKENKYQLPLAISLISFLLFGIFKSKSLSNES